MSLEHLDFSGNLLSGSIPPSLFEIPTIRSIALSINCFSGEIPNAVCNANNVEVLSMDGLVAADGCDWDTFTLPFIRRYVPLDGSIPECMWDMSNLTVMHFAGNGITGTIESFSPGSSLINISLAHNR